MKRFQITVIALLLSLTGFAQENLVTLGGGYAFANLKDTDKTGTGYRINGTYEYNPLRGSWAFGFTVGLIHLKADGVFLLQPIEYTLTSVPVFFTPKYLIGGEKFKGFIKGAVGVQYASFKSDRPNSIFSDRDFGFYMGGGAGVHYYFSETFFLSAEYELAYMTNSFYSDGVMNSAMAGIGFIF